MRFRSNYMKQISKRTLLTLALLATSLVFVSCVGYRGTETSGPTIQETENLVYIDLWLKPWIPCEAMKAEETPSGRMRVSARFANKHDQTMECQIEVKFKSADGRIVDDTGWMPFVLPRREVAQFEYTSLVTEPKDFTVLLREAKH